MKIYGGNKVDCNYYRLPEYQNNMIVICAGVGIILIIVGLLWMARDKKAKKAAALAAKKAADEAKRREAMPPPCSHVFPENRCVCQLCGETFHLYKVAREESTPNWCSECGGLGIYSINGLHFECPCGSADEPYKAVSYDKEVYYKCTQCGKEKHESFRNCQ